MKKEIGIIGYGRFGKVLVKYLQNDFNISVYDKKNESGSEHKDFSKTRFKFTSLEIAASKKIVILCTPISSTEDILKKIKRFISSKSIIIDVCSVKEYPVFLMRKYLPKDTEILGTHPLFGPDSIKNSLKNKKIILCPERISKKSFNSILQYLKQKRLKVIITNPKEHDRQTAWTLCLTHLIGNVLADAGISEKELDTLTFRELLHIKETVKNDTSELFYDMQTFNRFAGKMRKKVIDNLFKINSKIEKESLKRKKIKE